VPRGKRCDVVLPIASQGPWQKDPAAFGAEPCKAIGRGSLKAGLERYRRACARAGVGGLSLAQPVSSTSPRVMPDKIHGVVSINALLPRLVPPEVVAPLYEPSGCAFSQRQSVRILPKRATTEICYTAMPAVETLKDVFLLTNATVRCWPLIASPF